MKLCESKQAGSPFWALLFIYLFWRMYNASVLEYMQISATFWNLEQHDTHINGKFLSFFGYMFGLIDDLTNFIYNGNQKFINKWLNNKVMKIHVRPIPFFQSGSNRVWQNAGILSINKTSRSIKLRCMWLSRIFRIFCYLLISVLSEYVLVHFYKCRLEIIRQLDPIHMKRKILKWLFFLSPFYHFFVIH